MAEAKVNETMERIVSLCKRRGFVFQSSEIYGGINGFWDYGPLGAELKRNVKELWWNSMTRLRDDVVGLEATIIMAPQIWRASGHVDTFSDPMCDCLLTGSAFAPTRSSRRAAWCTTTPERAMGSGSEGRVCGPVGSGKAAGKRAQGGDQFYQSAAFKPWSCWESAPRRWRIPPASIRRTARCSRSRVRST